MSSNSVQAETARTLLAKADELRGVPAPDETATAHEMPEWVGFQRVYDLVQEGILVEVGRNEDGQKLYSTPENVWQRLQKLWQSHQRPEPPNLPCGHSGFSNLGDRYGCSTEGCDARYTRAELEGYWSGDRSQAEGSP